MARVVLPINFDEQTKLFNQIKSKHDADGAGSVLNMLLAEQNIDLAADDVAKAQAIIENTKHDKAGKQAEELKKERDLLFTPIFKDHKNMVQFLKTFYNDNINRLGNWGVNVVANTRIAYPANFSHRLKCIKLFVEKYNSLSPADNPLTLYLATNPGVLMPTLAQLENINSIHKNFEDISKKAEEATAERNVLWQPAMAHVRIIAEYLKKLFNQNPKLLGRYGFEVNENRKSPKSRKSTIKLGHSKVFSDVVIGGKLHNQSNTQLLIYKGRKIKGEPLTVLPQQSMLIDKGYSNITIVNSSNIETARIQIEVLK